MDAGDGWLCPWSHLLLPLAHHVWGGNWCEQWVGALTALQRASLKPMSLQRQHGAGECGSVSPGSSGTDGLLPSMPPPPRRLLLVEKIGEAAHCVLVPICYSFFLSELWPLSRPSYKRPREPSSSRRPRAAAALWNSRNVARGQRRAQQLCTRRQRRRRAALAAAAVRRHHCPAMPRHQFRTRPYGAEFCELAHHERAQRSVAEVRWRRAYVWAVAAVAGIAAGEPPACPWCSGAPMITAASPAQFPALYLPLPLLPQAAWDLGWTG